MNYFEPHLTPDELRAISAIGLAHMGDAIYETLVRTRPPARSCTAPLLRWSAPRSRRSWRSGCCRS